MGAVGLRAWHSIRRALAGTVLCVVVVALATGAVLALSAGARRTASAPDRLTAAAVGGGVDALVVQPAGAPRIDELRSLPSVEVAGFITFVGLVLPEESTAFDLYSLNPFAGDRAELLGRLVAGRDPDPSAPFEFTANPSFIDVYDAAIGDRFAVAAYTQDQLDTFAVTEAPAGERFEATLVGVVDSPGDLDDPTPSAVFSPALLQHAVGVVETNVGVVLSEGADLASLRSDLDSLPDGGEFSANHLQTVGASVRTSVDAQAKGLWVLTVVTAVAAIVSLGALLARRSLVAPRDASALRALGSTPTQLHAEAVLRTLVPASLGVALGVGAAVVASAWFPTGFVERLEPNPGVAVDVVALGGGAVFLLTCLLGWTAAASVLAARPTATAPNSGFVRRLAAGVPQPMVGTGIRFGLGRHERDARSVLAATAGISVALAGVCGALVFDDSIERLSADGYRYGNTFDVMVGNGWYVPAVDLGEVLAAEPGVARLMVLSSGRVVADGAALDVVGFESVKGGLEPTALSGRLPRSADEAALGRTTATSLGVSLGDTLDLEGSTGNQQFRVVGTVVVPSLGPNAGLASGAVLTLEGATRLDPAAQAGVAAVVLTGDARLRRQDVENHLRAVTQADTSTGTVPPPVRNVARLSGLPDALVALLATLGSALLIATVATSVRRRSRDLEVLSALGARAQQLGSIVRWQGAAVAMLPVLVGVPLGVLLGRVLAREFANRLGAVPDATVRFAWPLIAVAGAIGLGTLGAWVAWRGGRLGGRRLLSRE